METTVKKLALILLVASGLAGCVAYPVYDSPRSYYRSDPYYGYSYSYYRPYRSYSYYDSRYTW